MYATDIGRNMLVTIYPSNYFVSICKAISHKINSAWQAVGFGQISWDRWELEMKYSCRLNCDQGCQNISTTATIQFF